MRFVLRMAVRETRASMRRLIFFFVCIIIGGRDAPFRNAAARDALIPVRTRQLEATLQAWQPAAMAHTAFSWAGTFGETDDGMPVIGSVPGTDRIHYALGYGGNGIVFSLIAAELLRDLCLGRDNPDLQLYRPDRAH